MRLKVARNALIICAIFCSVTSTAHASKEDGVEFLAYVTGNTLYDQCKSNEDNPKFLMCISYIWGAVDYDNALFNAGLINRTYCIPPDVQSGQLKDVVLQYLSRHPEKRQLSGGALITFALHESFPCSQGGGK